MTKLSAAYSFVLIGWGIARMVLGDSTALLFAVNAFAMYLFVPLPLVALLAWLSGKRFYLLAAGVAALIFVYWWGGQLLTLVPRSHPPGEERVRVMTFNVFGYNFLSRQVVDVIRESDADVVGLVELNRENAEAIARDLADEYPYQMLDGREGTRGAGLISRYPLTAIEADLDDPEWVGEPLAVDVQVGERVFTYVRFHVPAMPSNHEARDRQAEKLAAFAAGLGRPVVVAGDLNATVTNTAYETLTRDLNDAWREAGVGFGHTFPTSTVPGQSRPTIRGVEVPEWLLRIDFVFHSSDLRAVAAKTASHGGSDHRPVIADLAFVE